MDTEFLARFVAESRWVVAKTMPNNPHEYTVRKWCDSEEFDRFITTIATEGWSADFKGRPFPHLDIGAYTYFFQGAPLASTIIVNRKPKDMCPGDRTALSWDALGRFKPREAT